MKIFTLSAVFVLLSLAAYAQHAEQPAGEFKPMKGRKLELKLTDPNAPSGPTRFKKPSDSLTLRQKPTQNVAATKSTKPQAGSPHRMPQYKPDSTILFPMLAAAPDSAVHYHLQVRKP